MNAGSEATLEAIRRGLALRPDQVDVNKAAPLFVPAAFLASGNWPGPFMLLRNAHIALTWSILLPDQTMRYVDHQIASYWESKGMDWKGIALNNLVEHSNENPGTHAFRRDDGAMYAIAMMHEDGIGPSRLLLRDRVSRIFPQGYRVALPEMSFGLAFSISLEDSEEEKLQGVVRHCYEKGTRPLAPGVYNPDDLLPVTS